MKRKLLTLFAVFAFMFPNISHACPGNGCLPDFISSEHFKTKEVFSIAKILVREKYFKTLKEFCLSREDYLNNLAKRDDEKKLSLSEARFRGDLIALLQKEAKIVRLAKRQNIRIKNLAFFTERNPKTKIHDHEPYYSAKNHFDRLAAEYTMHVSTNKNYKMSKKMRKRIENAGNYLLLLECKKFVPANFVTYETRISTNTGTEFTIFNKI